MNRVASLLLGVGLAFPVLLKAGVDTAWVRRYDGPAHLGDYATCIAVDSQGNVVVAGVTAGADSTPDWVTIKYSSTGDSLWADRRSFTGNGKPLGMGVDTADNVYVTGYQNTQAVTIKYSPTGQLLWESRLPSESYAKDLALDAAGNVLICGSALNSSYDFMAVKYRSNGDTAWVRYYDWLGDLDDARALAVGEDGSVVVTGPGYGNGTGDDYLTVKYDSSGNRQWAATYHGPAGPDTPVDIVVAGEGDVFVSGNSEGATSSWDYLTVKYSPSGDTLWARRFNGAANGDDEAEALAVDAVGSAAVTGYAQFEAGNRDYATVRYDSAGNQVWVARYDGPASGLDHAYAIGVDQVGNAYVTGGVRVQQLASGCVTIKYDYNGDTVWVATYVAPPSTPNYGTAIALGTDGCVYVAGTYDSDILVIKYVQSGGVTETRGTPVVSGVSLVAEPSVFRSRTALHLCVDKPAAVQVAVYDAEGRRVQTLTSGLNGIGATTVTWDGCDERGVRLSQGVYILVLDAGGQSARVKVVMSE